MSVGASPLVCGYSMFDVLLAMTLRAAAMVGLLSLSSRISELNGTAQDAMRVEIALLDFEGTFRIAASNALTLPSLHTPLCDPSQPTWVNEWCVAWETSLADHSVCLNSEANSWWVVLNRESAGCGINGFNQSVGSPNDTVIASHVWRL